MSKLIIANWKSNHTLESAQDWLKQVNQFLADEEPNLQPVLAPPFPLISGLQNLVMSSQLQLAVQDISPYEAGSYTGAVSTANLIGLPVDYAIVGHSERRRYFGEIDEMEADKVQQCLTADITPVLCVDEPYLKSQAKALKQTGVQLPGAKLIAAYEPLSAIGTGENADFKQVQQVVKKIKKEYGDVRVIYGGSVDAVNIAGYLAVTDGVLVGGASLGADYFIELMRAAEKK